MFKDATKILMSYTGNIIYSIIIFFIGFLLVKIINKGMDKWRNKPRRISNISTQKRVNTLSTLLKSIFKYIVYFIVVVLILEKFNIPIKTILAVAGIGGVAIGFGAQSLIKDIIAGMFLIIEDQLSVGDYVIVDSKSGTVLEMGLKTVKIQDFNGSIHIIPNGSIGSITNLSRTNSRAIVDVKLSITKKYEDVLEKLDEVFQSIKEKFKEVIIEDPSVLGIVDTNWLEYTIRIVVVTKPLKHWEVEREIRKLIIDKLFSK